MSYDHLPLQSHNGSGHLVHQTSVQKQTTTMKRNNSRRRPIRRPTPHPRIFLLNRLYAKRWWIIAIVLTVLLFGVIDKKAEQRANNENENKAHIRKKQSNGGSSSSSSSSSSWTGVNRSVLLQRATQSMQQDRVGEVDVYWQMPAVAPLRGILFLAHGCHHVGTNWWPYDKESCPTCLELPEERAIVEIALTRFRLAVMSVSSANRGSGCWGQADGPRVSQVLHEMHQLLTTTTGANNQTQLPIYALGASSGGGFVNHILPDAMERAGLSLAGFISEISPPSGKPNVASDRVASVFITMPKDSNTRTRSEAFVEQQTKGGHMARHVAVREHAVTPTFFQERIPSISLELSKQLAEALKDKGFLDASTNLLLSDPRRSEWRAVVQPILDAAKHEDSLVADQSPLSEVMNVAWGQHEMTRDGVSGALGWLLATWQKTKSVEHA